MPCNRSGWLDKAALLQAYRSADVVLNPSLGEGMPNTVLEAMACAVAVIASRVNGNSDLVDHGKTGLLFDPILAAHVRCCVIRAGAST